MTDLIAELPLIAAAMEPDDDSILVARAKLDCVAFADLYHRYCDRVYSYLRLRTRDSEEAADLTHHVFANALDALPRYKERGLPFAAWLMRIARNVAIDAARKRRITLELDLVPEACLVDEGADPAGAVLERERLQRLRGVIADLDPAKRDLLALRFLAGLSAREIGLVIGKSEAATKKLIARTLNTLKEKCNEEMV